MKAKIVAVIIGIAVIAGGAYVATSLTKVDQGEANKAKAEADKAVTITNAEAEAEANRIISESITENLIKMTEAEARKEHGWVEVQGADAIVKEK